VPACRLVSACPLINKSSLEIDKLVDLVIGGICGFA
jgi:hypothetical protein